MVAIFAHCCFNPIVYLMFIISCNRNKIKVDSIYLTYLCLILKISYHVLNNFFHLPIAQYFICVYIIHNGYSNLFNKNYPLCNYFYLCINTF